MSKEPKSIKQILESEPKNAAEYFEQLDLKTLPAKVDFEKQYTDPRWYDKREEILKDRNHTCEGCDATECTLQVHHSYYEMGLMAWEYDNSTLWCLCLDCHDKWGKMKNLLQRRMGEISLKRLRVFDKLIDIFEEIAKAEKMINNFVSKFNRNQ